MEANRASATARKSSQPIGDQSTAYRPVNLGPIIDTAQRERGATGGSFNIPGVARLIDRDGLPRTRHLVSRFHDAGLATISFFSAKVGAIHPTDPFL